MEGPGHHFGYRRAGAIVKLWNETFEIARYYARKRRVTSPDFPVGNRDMGRMVSDRKCADKPVDVEVPPEPRAKTSDTPAGMLVDEPVLGKTGPGRRLPAVWLLI